jgi:DNA-binding NarL/FixJ family response regulator
MANPKMKDRKPRVLIVEDEPTIAQEIAFNLEDHGFQIAGMALSAQKALDILFQKEVDIALLDISIMGNTNGIELGRIINQKYKIPFLYLTSFADDETIHEAADTFPAGYIVKPFKDNDLAPALRVALAKHKRNKNDGLPTLDLINKNLISHISSGEFRVIQLIWQGKKNHEIAADLFISVNTVKSHMNNIYRKLDINSKTLLINKLRSY